MNSDNENEAVDKEDSLTDKKIANENIKSKKNKKKTKKKLNIEKEIIGWIKSIAFVIIFTFIFLRIFTNARIPSSSMENTIMTEDRLFGYNFAYKGADVKRGDIIIFRMPDEPHEIYIKRVIGIAGDEISYMECENDNEGSEIKVVRNGEILDEPYIKEPMIEFEDKNLTFKVPENSVFVMGDNRNNSYDGRYWENHFVDKNAIIAKAIFRYWPLNKMGVVK